MTHIFSLILIKYSKHGIFLHFYFRYTFRSFFRKLDYQPREKSHRARRSINCALSLFETFVLSNCLESNQIYKGRSSWDDKNLDIGSLTLVMKSPWKFTVKLRPDLSSLEDVKRNVTVNFNCTILHRCRIYEKNIYERTLESAKTSIYSILRHADWGINK